MADCPEISPMGDAAPEPRVAMMARETRVREGVVPQGLGGIAVGEDAQAFSGDEYLLRTPLGLAFHYRRGEGVTVERAPGADPRDEALFLKGSVHAAVAAINGLTPIHASAVAHAGVVHAFTGPSGAGKSTLIAELGRRGMPMFCDDTLVLDLADPARPMALPGHKRLKLWPDALAMTGADRREQVASMAEKFYAEPAAGSVGQVLPMATLTFLAEGEPARIEPVRGAQAMALLQDDHYTTDMVLDARRPDRAARFRQLAGLAQALRIARFVRPRDPQRFAADLGLVETAILAFSLPGAEETA